MSNEEQCPDSGFSGSADAAHGSDCGESLAATEPESNAGPSETSSCSQQIEEETSEIDSYLGRSVLIAMVGVNCCGLMTAAMSSIYWLLALGLPPAIFAAIAIMHGIRVGDRETTGDHDGALESSESARKWNKISRHLMWPGLATLFILFIVEGFKMMMS